MQLVIVSFELCVAFSCCLFLSSNIQSLLYFVLLSPHLPHFFHTTSPIPLYFSTVSPTLFHSLLLLLLSHSACSVLLGWVESPGYPTGYLPHSSLNWSRCAPKGHTLSLKIVHLNMEDSQDCENDALKVRYPHLRKSGINIQIYRMSWYIVIFCQNL